MSGKRGASPVSRHYNELPEGWGGYLRRYVSRSPSAGVGSGEGAGEDEGYGPGGADEWGGDHEDWGEEEAIVLDPIPCNYL